MSNIIPIKDKSALVLDDGKVYKIQSSRQRRILACMECHKRKTKCSRERPTCTLCMKNNWPCVYFCNERVSRNKDKDELLGVIAKAKGLLPSDAGEFPKVTIPGKKIPVQKGTNGENATPSSKFPSSVNTEKSVDKVLLSPSTPALIIAGGGKMQLEQSTDAAANGLERDASAGAVLPTTPMSNTDATPTGVEGTEAGASGDDDLADVAAYKLKSDYWLQVFMEHVQPYIPLMNVELVTQTHTTYWKHKLEGQDEDMVDDLVILYPVYYAAQVVIKQSNSDNLYDHYEELCTDLFYNVVRFPVDIELGNNYNLLVGITLFQMVSPLPNYNVVASLIRIYQLQISIYGYTRELTHLFKYLCCLDVRISTMLQLQPMLRYDEIENVSKTAQVGEVLPWERALFRSMVISNDLLLDSSLNVVQFKYKINELYAICLAASRSMLSLNSKPMALFSRFIMMRADSCLAMLHFKLKNNIPGFDYGSLDAVYSYPITQVYHYEDPQNLVPACMHHMVEYLSLMETDFKWLLHTSSDDFPMNSLCVVATSVCRDVVRAKNVDLPRDTRFQVMERFSRWATNTEILENFREGVRIFDILVRSLIKRFELMDSKGEIVDHSGTVTIWPVPMMKPGGESAVPQRRGSLSMPSTSLVLPRGPSLTHWNNDNLPSELREVVSGRSMPYYKKYEEVLIKLAVSVMG